MTKTLHYLSAHDVRALAISPAAARQAIIDAFRDHHQGRNLSLPKYPLTLGPGHGFQAMLAASCAQDMAAVKWVAMAPVAAGSAQAGINGIICLNDYASGAPIALMDGNEITLIRTAAMSAAAATFLAPKRARTLGMVGCGRQAHAHLAAFCDLLPQLDALTAYSRSRTSAQLLVDAARARGLTASVAATPDAVVATSDVLISMVPAAPGLTPFLDARQLKHDAFVSAIDIGRSWLPESLSAFDLRATDSLQQSQAPYDVHDAPVASASFQTDLIALCTGTPITEPGRKLFCFRGFAIADLALATLVLRQAKTQGKGIELQR